MYTPILKTQNQIMTDLYPSKGGTNKSGAGLPIVCLHYYRPAPDLLKIQNQISIRKHC